MFDSENRNSESIGEPSDEDIQLAVTRLVAAFGGGELVAVQSEKPQPLTAA